MVKFQWIPLGMTGGTGAVTRVPGGLLFATIFSHPDEGEKSSGGIAFVPCPAAEAEEFIEFNRCPHVRPDGEQS